MLLPSTETIYRKRYKAAMGGNLTESDPCRNGGITTCVLLYHEPSAAGR